jgi:hypothetical protein
LEISPVVCPFSGSALASQLTAMTRTTASTLSACLTIWTLHFGTASRRARRMPPRGWRQVVADRAPSGRQAARRTRNASNIPSAGVPGNGGDGWRAGVSGHSERARARICLIWASDAWRRLTGWGVLCIVRALRHVKLCTVLHSFARSGTMPRERRPDHHTAGAPAPRGIQQMGQAP